MIMRPAIALLAAAIGWSSTAQAAWTEPRGTGLVIPSYFFYRAVRQHDAHGHGADREPYVKHELRLYSVYGLTDTTTLGFDGAARRVRDHAPGAAQEDLDWSETAVFARIRLLQWSRSVLSVQPLVRLPRMHGQRGDLGRDADAPETELRVLYGQSFAVFGRDGFAVIESAYRKRFGDAADQVRVDATIGFRVRPRILLLAQSFNVISTRRPREAGPPDYDLYKAQFSVVYDLGARWSVQLGGFTEYAGRNTGVGNAGFLALWWRF